MKILRIHRLTLAVRDIEAARDTFGALFGADSAGVEDVREFGVRRSLVELGDDQLELASPLEADHPLTRFLSRKGEGFYNLALEVDDLDAAVAELSAQGVRISDPVEAEPGLRSAFVTMAATHGLSIQLVEPARIAAPAVATAPPLDDQQAATVSAIEPTDEAAVLAGPPRLLDLTPDEWQDEE